VLLALILGNIADGGGDFTVVSFLPFDVTVLFEVDSVTIGCATVSDVAMIKPAQTASFFIIYSP
jgi:hypothetical protein